MLCEFYLQIAIILSRSQWSLAGLLNYSSLQLAFDAGAAYRYHTRQVHHSHSHPHLSCSRRVSGVKSTPTPLTTAVAAAVDKGTPPPYKAYVGWAG